jgi:hypothetical protein
VVSKVEDPARGRSISRREVTTRKVMSQKSDLPDQALQHLTHDQALPANIRLKPKVLDLKNYWPDIVAKYF